MPLEPRSPAARELVPSRPPSVRSPASGRWTGPRRTSDWASPVDNAAQHDCRIFISQPRVYAHIQDTFWPMQLVMKSAKEGEEATAAIDAADKIKFSMLGDLKKTNFDKPESEGGAALQFELEANNFDLDQRGT